MTIKIILKKFVNNLYPIQDPDTGHVYKSHKEFILNTFGGLDSYCLDKIIGDYFSNYLGLSPKINKQDFPYTYDYIKDASNKNTKEIINELKNTNIYVSSGQILCHGGKFPIGHPKIGTRLKTCPMFSTSIDPSIAAHHAVQETPCNLWIINIHKEEQCLPVQIDGQEECEILIFNSLNLEIKDIRQITSNNSNEIITCFFLNQILN